MANMASKASILQILSLFLICICPYYTSSFNANYPAVFNFGDSNSDTGGNVAGLGRTKTVLPPYGQTYFKKANGRFCDGRLIIDFLMGSMHLPYLNTYLDSIGAPSFKNGCDFAVAGSTILPPKTANAFSPFPFGIQVSQFIRFQKRVLELQTEGRKKSRYIPDGNVFKNALYTFDIGQNDLATALNANATYDEAIASIPTILEAFENGTKRLYQEGDARNFWIHNSGPLGCLAQYITQFGNDSSKLDDIGCVISLNQASKVLNQQLYALVKKLQAQYTDAKFTHVDIFSIKYDLIANYHRYEFEQPLMVCCGVGGPPLNYADGWISCGHTKNLNNGTSFLIEAYGDSSKFVNWDGVHYTEAANRFVATQILKGKYSDPPFADRSKYLPKN